MVSSRRKTFDEIGKSSIFDNDVSDQDLKFFFSERKKRPKVIDDPLGGFEI